MQGMFYESDDEIREQAEIPVVRDSNDKTNLFYLAQQQKTNINKRLPRGFCLIRKQDYDRLTFMKRPALDNIVYQPVKVARNVQIDNPIAKTIDQAWTKRQQQARKSNRLTLQTSVEGRSRQSEKIKNIIQRFRKLLKNTQVQNYLNKVGLMLGLNEIEIQNKKGLLTIDTFKDRYMIILDTAKSTTFETDVINQIDQMIEQFMCYVEQARKTEFENNIQSIQKSIDKITRYLTDTTDSKTQANWYIRKRKKGEKNENYTQKQILYIAELIRKLPAAYLVGVLELVYERPFGQLQRKVQKINLIELDAKKIRDIQVYVKSKLSQLYRSRERKKQKIQAKKEEKQRIKQQMIKKEKKQEVQEKNLSLIDQIERIFDSDDKAQGIDRLAFANTQKANVKTIQVPDIQYEPFDINKIKKAKNEQQQIKEENLQMVDQNRPKEDDDSMDINNSSDSSMITDEDDSDY